MKKVKQNQKDLKEYLQVAKTASLEASKILLKYQKKLDKLKLNIKESQGLSSSADLASEKLIIKILKQHFPTHQVLAEEGSYGRERDWMKGHNETPFTWVIDPLDGTNNYLNGLPFYAISIGLLYFGKPVVGCVYQPATDEVYWSMLGGGAYKGTLREISKPEKLYREKSKPAIKDCIFCSGFAISERERFDLHEFRNFKVVYKEARAVRRFGAAALELCYVASGALDGFWESGLYPWDVAAAGLICEESGVKVSDFDGRSFTPFDKTIIAARKPVYSQVIKLIEK